MATTEIISAGDGTRTRLSRLQQIAIAGALAVMSLFYFWTATTSVWSSRPLAESTFYYPLIARSFLAGQLNLIVNPRPELLALKDPYDPAQNWPYRLHDAILFKSKYYLYYGPAPVLVVFAPFRWVTGLDCPEPPVVAMFCTIALVFAWLLVRFLSRTYLPQTPFWLTLATVPALAFGNEYPFLLRRAIHYEVAIAAGHAFVFASAYFFVVGTLGERVRKGYLASASLLLGLAIGSRFPLMAAGVIPTVLAAYVILTRRREPLRDHVTTVLAFFGPVAVCLFLLGLYNYLRFESWTQFGLVYTLQDWRSARTYQFIDMAHVPPGLYYYLLVPPRLSPAFPFIFLDPQHSLMPPDDYWVESIGGILPVVPLVGILLFAPAFIAAFRRVKPALCVAMVTPLVVGGLMFGLYAFWAAIMRYETDFGTFFLIPSLLLWFAVINSLGKSDWRRGAVLATFAALLVATVTINGAISLTGYYDNLRAGSPATYEAIHDVFRPLERFFSAL